MTILLASGVAQDRTPVDVVVSADSRWLLTANRDSGSVSLVDLESKSVVAEVATGRSPFGIAWSGDWACVSNANGDSVTHLEVRPPELRALNTFAVGSAPRGIAIAGNRAYVALSEDDAVAVVDLRAGIVVDRVRVGSSPFSIALFGNTAFVGNAGSGDLTVFSCSDLTVLAVIPLKASNVRRIAISRDGSAVFVPHILNGGSSTTIANIEHGRVIRNHVSRLSVRDSRVDSLALDTPGYGAGDPECVAVNSEQTRLAVAVGGTRSVLLLSLPLPFEQYAPTFLPDNVINDRSRYRRVAGLPGRPVSCTFTPDGETVVVACALSNSIELISWHSGISTGRIQLGGGSPTSLTRQGEEIFYDAERSWHKWFSCNTCHPDGHTNGAMYDTLGDGRYGNPKKVLSLRGVSKTGPWNWDGRHADLSAAVQSSFKNTMARRELTDAELGGVMAFLETLDFRPQRSAAASVQAKGGKRFFSRRDAHRAIGLRYIQLVELNMLALIRSRMVLVGIIHRVCAV